MEREFEQVKFNIKVNNYINAIKKLSQHVKDNYLYATGEELSDDRALSMAHSLFCGAKRSGVLDELNSVVEV